MLNFAAVHHLQFGTDIVFTYGPLGYLMQNQYSPGTWWQVVLFQMLSRAIYLALLWRIVRCAAISAELSNISTVAFAVFSAFLPALDSDSFYLLFIVFAGAICLARNRAGWIEPAGLALVAVMGLLKGTYLVFGLTTLALVVLWCLLNRQVLKSCLLAGIFILTFVFAWCVLARQQLPHIGPWLQSVMDMTTAYQLSMAVVPAANQLICALVVFVSLGFLLLRGLLGSKLLWSAVLIMACGLFLAWKQGLTRGDEYHPKTFFVYALVILTSLPLVLRVTPNRLVFVFLCGLCLGTGLVDRLPVPFYRAYENLRFLVRLPRMPELYKENAHTFALPRIREAVGDSTIDVAGAEQAIAILNNLNYHPAPVFQTYSAGIPALIRRNADFYSSERAPQFVIVPPEYRVDQRLPNLEESLSGLVLAQWYQPVLEESGYRLLKRVAKPQIESGHARSGETRIGERLNLEGGDWCVVVMKENLLGRLVRFVWASPPVYANIALKHGGIKTYRFVPGFAEAGFVAPADVISLQVNPTAAARWCFKPVLKYEIQTLDSAR